MDPFQSINWERNSEKAVITLTASFSERYSAMEIFEYLRGDIFTAVASGEIPGKVAMDIWEANEKSEAKVQVDRKAAHIVLNALSEMSR